MIQPTFLEAESGRLIILQSNFSLVVIRFNLQQVINTAKLWCEVRERGRRADSQLVFTWIQTTKGGISNFLRDIDDTKIKVAQDKVWLEIMVARLRLVDDKLSYLRESIEVNTLKQIWDTCEVRQVRYQDLLELEEIIRILK